MTIYRSLKLICKWPGARVKRDHLLLPGLMLLCATSFGQVLNERLYVKGGSRLWENLVKEMYLYPEFREGTVEYRNGQVFKRPLNYNTMLATIQFINEKKDTLAIANEAAVRVIKIGDDEFIFDSGCLRMIKVEGKFKLFKNVKVHIADVRQVGAYGKLNTASGIETPNQVYTWMNTYQLEANEVLLLNKATTFFIISSESKVIPANRNNFIKLVPGNETEIRKFIRSKNIDFKTEADLVNLVEFVSGLKVP